MSQNNRTDRLADRMRNCSDCKLSKSTELEVLDKILIGEEQAQDWFCQTHEQKLAKLQNEWSNNDKNFKM